VEPTFSVLVAAYNAAGTIAETLDSLLAQTRGDWEAIVVDDGSADETAAIVMGYAARDPRITVQSKVNGGTASARNFAARIASGRMWCLLDADDLYLPGYLDHMGRFIDEHPDRDIYSASGYYFRDQETPWPDEFPENRSVCTYRVEDMLAKDCFSVHSVFRPRVFALAGGFDEDPRMVNEDYCFWLTAMLRGATHIHNPERLWMYRMSEGQKTSDRIRCMRSDVYLLGGLIARKEIVGSRARIARSARRELLTSCRMIRSHQRRVELERQLTCGELKCARLEYLLAWRAYGSKAKYLAGLPIMLLSPSLFGRLLPRIAAGVPRPDL